MALTIPTGIHTVIPGEKTNALSAAMESRDPPSLLEARIARIVRGDPELAGERWFVREGYASPGLEETPEGAPLLVRKLDRGWLLSAERAVTNNGLKDVLVDLDNLPVQYIGRRVPLVTYLIGKVVIGGNEIRIVPEPNSLTVSPNAPRSSDWCELNYDGIFQHLNKEDMARIRRDFPLMAAYLWLKQKPSAGLISIYGDGTGQAVNAYYTFDFTARSLERGRQLTELEMAGLRNQLEARGVRTPEVKQF